MRKVFAALWFWLFCAPAFAGVSCSLPFTLLNNTLADATQVMANYNALVTCLGNAAAAGSNSDITALNSLSTPLTPAQGGSSVYTFGTSTGSANAQVIASPAPTGFAKTLGNSIIFTAGFTNTAATQINVNSTGLTNLFRQTPSGPQAMTGGEILAGNQVWAVYDGTQFEMVSNGPQFGGFGPQVSIASAATTDLGTVPTHNVVITGVAAITSFGSTANAAYPIYRIAFSGSLVLTYNASSMILPGTLNITTQANDTATALYLGSGNWQIVDYQTATGLPVIAQKPLCGFSGLTLSNGASGTVVNWSYNTGSVVNSTGTAFTASSAQSGTFNTGVGTGGTSTAGGMDGSAVGANQFVAIWAIYNGATFSSVGTKNSYPTLPAFPSGYFAACYMGSFKTNGASNLFGELIVGNEANFVVGGANIGGGAPSATNVLPQLSTGTQGTNCNTAATATYQNLAVRGNNGATVWMPASATVGAFTLAGATAANSWVAPNATYGGGLQPVGSGATAASQLFRFNMESNSIFYCSLAGGAVLAQYGWKDAVNAN